MKRFLKSFLVLATSLVAFNACNEEVLPEIPEETHSISFVATTPQTKTSANIDNVNKTVSYNWSDEDVDRFEVYEIVGENYTPASKVEAVIIEDKMYLDASFKGVVTPDAKYVALLNKGVKESQNATDEEYDQESDVLVSEEVKSSNIEGETLELRFKRETAFALMTAKSLEGEYVLGTSITANKTIAANYDYKAKAFEVDGSKTIVVSDNGEPISLVEGNQAKLFIASVPVEDASLTVGVVTGDESGAFKSAYEKSFAEGKSISFTRGNVVTFNIGMNKVEGLSLDLSTDQTTTATTEEITWDKTFVSIASAKVGSGTAANNYYPGKSNTSTRFYKGNTLTFTPKLGVSVKEIVYTATTEGYATTLANSTWTNAIALASEKKVTITPTDGTKTVSATLSNTTGASEIVVTYGIPVQPITYSITIASLENGSVTADPSSNVLPGSEVTLTATPDDGYEFGSWNVTNEDTKETITITSNKFTMPAANVNVSATFNEIQGGGDSSDDVLSVDFESETSAYSDWTFTNITTQKTDANVSAHGGSYFGTTNGQTTGSVQTKDKVTSPGTIKFYISKLSNNTTASSWKIQTSSNGTSWTDVKTVSASSVTRGQWTEVSQNLSEYSNVYVRVYYTGTTAVRCIDDLTLTTSSGSVTTYNVTISDDIVNGTVTASLMSAAEGATITLTASPAAGYEFDSWNVIGATVASASSSTTTFTMPAADVTVSAAFKEIVPLKTMDEIFSAASTAGSTATSARVTFNNWIVSGVNGSNAYLTDNNGKGLIIYGSSHGFEKGDILSGTVNCKVQLYNGSSELTTLNSTAAGLTVAKGGVITPKTIAISELAGVNTGAVLTFESLTYDGADFSDGVNTIKPYKTFITLPTLEIGKNYSVTGVYIQYKDTKEIAPRTTDDIVEIVDIVAGPTTVTWTAATASDNPGNGETWFSGPLDDNIKWAATRGGANDPTYYDNGTALRIYNGGVFTITAENGKKITKVVLKFKDGSSAFSLDTNTATQTYDVDHVISKKWNISNFCCYLQTIEVTYE